MMEYAYKEIPLEHCNRETKGGSKQRTHLVRRCSRLYFLCLTVGMGGLQVVWTTIMSGGSPFLLSLKLPTSMVSLVWLIGPLCGTVLQPYIGFRSDICTHPWGRRTPFIIWGTLATIICMIALSWTRESSTAICYLLGIRSQSLTLHYLTIATAVGWTWALNAAVQPVQAGLRALIVDSTPADQQGQANAFASCAILTGSILGYGYGFVDLPKAPSWLLNGDFKCLCLLASLVLGITVSITCAMIRESIRAPTEAKVNSGVLQVYLEIYKCVANSSHEVRRILLVQFFAWLAWFPFLFYITTYLGELYKDQILWNSLSPPSTRFYNSLTQQSRRHGVLAMVLFAIVALLANIALPRLLTTSSRTSTREHDNPDLEQNLGLTDKPSSNWLTLSKAWMISHVLMAICLFFATLGNSFISTVCFTALLGVSWALTQWAPYALISAEIASDDRLVTGQHRLVSGSKGNPVLESDIEQQGEFSSEVLDLGNQHTGRRAGTVMGVHNIAIALPQMISALMCSLIFFVCHHQSFEDVVAMRWILRVGVLAAIMAAYLTKGLQI